MTGTEDAYLSRIESRQAARAAYLAKARHGAEAIGRDALALKDLGMSVSEIARRVNIPRPTLNEFMAAAANSDTPAGAAAPAPPLPVLSGSDLVEAVQAGGPVTEIAASFADSDTMFLSREPFTRFANPNWGSAMHIPHLMLRLEEASWIGVANATVGYGGTGPGNAHRALSSVGIDDEIAKEVAFYNRVSHVIFDDDGNPDFRQKGLQWPRFGLTTPEPFGDNLDRFRIKMLVTDGASDDDEPATFRAPDVVNNGFYPSPPDDLTLWQRWLKYLDDPPAWLPGPETRHGTLFTSLQAAGDAGFSDETLAERAAMRAAVRIVDTPHSTYPLIIEQGPIQLWITAYTSADPTVWVPPEFHDILRDAGLLPTDVIDADRASTLRKLVSRHRNRRPSSIPLGPGHASLP
ncbi:hypothetical protein H7J87_11935 [Mycolicibacterium wolinskyi]|uniref:Uncharacterized protein n=1 Tax=Mycolicibacterium wolinskyi TaxID=59750 RepID=A0A1X2FJ48_9MYCO|nr:MULTISPECIES: hypothetical protein [Mycolicibacterium]MCV7286041.1 hypothetical protein [Mycolicibacterium wolinskyi]MCV7296237.1 hypothetical protein [Mycolicibacterium goodii]ORX18470.1 hypothetical protein AWC31_14295 [Mycolicibacterium wolinskyi]